MTKHEQKGDKVKIESLLTKRQFATLILALKDKSKEQSDLEEDERELGSSNNVRRHATRRTFVDGLIDTILEDAKGMKSAKNFWKTIEEKD
jgi:hypothetical protein